MTENNTDQHYDFQDISTIVINFDNLNMWRHTENDKNDLPIYSFLSLYQACGIMDDIQTYCDKHNTTIIAADNLLCNFYTLQRLKNYIEHNWEIYSIGIDANNHVFWKDDRWGHKPHYPKSLNKTIKASLVTDCINFCPGIDDELEDNVIVFRVVIKNETKGE